MLDSSLPSDSQEEVIPINESSEFTAIQKQQKYKKIVEDIINDFGASASPMYVFVTLLFKKDFVKAGIYAKQGMEERMLSEKNCQNLQVYLNARFSAEAFQKDVTSILENISKMEDSKVKAILKEVCTNIASIHKNT